MSWVARHAAQEARLMCDWSVDELVRRWIRAMRAAPNIFVGFLELLGSATVACCIKMNRQGL